jgi:hypothetical protein
MRLFLYLSNLFWFLITVDGARPVSVTLAVPMVSATFTSMSCAFSALPDAILRNARPEDGTGVPQRATAMYSTPTSH